MTEGFSFAYLKELFLSAMMQWIAGDRSASLDAVIIDQITRLQQQTGRPNLSQSASA